MGSNPTYQDGWLLLLHPSVQIISSAKAGSLMSLQSLFPQKKLINFSCLINGLYINPNTTSAQSSPVWNGDPLSFLSPGEDMRKAQVLMCLKAANFNVRRIVYI